MSATFGIETVARIASSIGGRVPTDDDRQLGDCVCIDRRPITVR
jgi:hypothetical protein